MIDNIYKTGKNLLRTVPCQTNLLIKFAKKNLLKKRVVDPRSFSHYVVNPPQ